MKRYNRIARELSKEEIEIAYAKFSKIKDMAKYLNVDKDTITKAKIKII